MRKLSAFRSPSPFATVAAALFIVLAFAQAAAAATLSGRATDPDGRPVAGARVVATTPIGATAEATTDRQGDFSIADLPAGRYDLHVVADGFAAPPIAIGLDAGDDRRVDIQLRLSAISESVVVSAAQVDIALSQAADRVIVVTAADLAAHQAENVADALRLVPGLTVTRSGGRGGLTSIFPRGGESDRKSVV